MFLSFERAFLSIHFIDRAYAILLNKPSSLSHFSTGVDFIL